MKDERELWFAEKKWYYITIFNLDSLVYTFSQLYDAKKRKVIQVMKSDGDEAWKAPRRTIRSLSPKAREPGALGMVRYPVRLAERGGRPWSPSSVARDGAGSAHAPGGDCHWVPAISWCDESFPGTEREAQGIGA